MKNPEYNLLDEPWIPVRLLDGSVTEVGMLELLRRTTDIADLACELPTQSIAIQRLILAVAYRVATPRDMHDWARQWDQGAPTDQMIDYLERWRDRFFLFGGEYPFMQVADLKTARDEAKPLSVIIANLPKEEKRLFSSRSGAGADWMSAAEAARWLVHVQNYDSSGIRSGAEGDPKAPAGRGSPIGPAWCAQLGIVWIKGNDLDETIVLNLIPSDSGRLEGGDNSSDWGACTWEKADPWTANRDDYSVVGKKGTTKAESLSIPKLMTWQSRRVRLFGDSAGVTKVLVCQGDKLTSHNMFRYEPQSMWRYDSGASKKSVDVYKAFNFTTDRAMWRNLPGVFCPQVKVKVGGGREVDRVLQPATLMFHHSLQLNRVKTRYPVRLRLQAVGMIFVSKEKTDYKAVYFDELTLFSILLSERSDKLVAEIKDQVMKTEEVANLIGRYARDIARAAGGIGDVDAERARQQFYAAVDTQFRSWLSGIDGHEKIPEIRKSWEDVLRKTTRMFQKEIGDAAPQSSIIGRYVGKIGSKNVERYLSLGIAENSFRYGLLKLLPAVDSWEGVK